jgi:hypothetical protein
MKVTIGIDDTDNLTSRGTGFMARQLLAHLHESEILIPEIILRHQLLVDDRIPYTSHNSSASITGQLISSEQNLKDACISYLLEHSADGSDVGLCIFSNCQQSNNQIIEWGYSAKEIVLTYEDAISLAEKSNIFLTGLTGQKTGIIGALAAVGLSLSANDGRVLWIKGLREANGVYSAEKIKIDFGIEIIKEISGSIINNDSRVLLSDWTRPVMQNGNLTLFVENQKNNEYEYQTASKCYIKSISE